MIYSVDVTNYLGETLTLELAAPEKSGVLIQKIDGIGPNEANINTAGISGSDGSIFNSAILEDRNITFELRFLEKPDIETTRHLVYRYFPIKQPVTLVFTTDTRKLKIIGYVESDEPDIFSKEEGTTISIICPDPYLYQADVQDYVFYGVDPAFEFEFSNESLTDPLLEFGIIFNEPTREIFYNGDFEVGARLLVHFIGDVEGLKLYNLTNMQQSLIIDDAKLSAIAVGGFQAGDDLEISSRKGNKYATLTRSGTAYNVLNAITQDSDWLTLLPGNNTIAFTATTGDAYLEFRMMVDVAYEGV